MKPLAAVAMGMVVIVLVAPVGGYDALPDPVGWLLVLLGVRRLRQLPQWQALMGLGGLALVVAVALWWPDTQTWLDRQDPSLRWALALPQLGFQALACHSAGALATGDGDTSAARWLRTALIAVVVVAVLPVLVFAAGNASAAWTYIAAGFASLLVIWLLFSYSGRAWARPES